MNSTSRASRLVSRAARSPALAITGPEVARKLTPSSRATICAKVVLPSPGGPTKSTWSSASWRARAASTNTERFERACCCPMNSASRCGRSELSTLSSVRRSAATRRGVELKQSSQRSLPAVLVGEQIADWRDRGTVRARHDHPCLAVVIPNQFAAAAAGRYHRNSLFGVGGLGMAHRHDGFDSGLTRFGDGTPERHRLGTDRHAAEIGIEIDAGIDAPLARAHRRTHLLPVVPVASRDRLFRRGNQLLVTRTQHRRLSESFGQLFEPQPNQACCVS